MTDPRRSRHGCRGWWVAGIVTACAVAAGGIGIPLTVAAATPAQDYRTTTAGNGPVSQTLQVAGTVQRVNQTTASFASSATVTAVDVAVGETVAAGQRLASEDPTTLQAALLSAQATLAKDQATLAADESGAGQSSPAASAAASGDASTARDSSTTSAASGSARTPSTAGAGATARSTTTPATRGGTPSVAALTASLAAANAQLTAVRKDLTDTDGLCAAVTDGSTSSGTGGATSTSASTPRSGGTGTSTGGGAGGGTGATGTGATGTGASDTGTSTGGTGTSGTGTSGTGTGTSGTGTSGTGTGGASQGGAPATPTADQVTACESALSHITDALQAVEQSVSTILTRVVAASAPTSPPTGGASAATAHTTTVTSQARSTAARSSSGVGASAGSAQSPAAREAADEAAILQDQQAVTQAQSNLAGATLTAPVAGRVGAVTLIVGQQATASTGVTIVGAGAATVTVQIPLDAMTSVHAGQQAAVTPAGGTAAVAGTVQTVGLLPSSTSGSTPTYPATVLVPAPTAAMPSGAQASVAVTIGRATDTVRVPESALAGHTGQSATVTVLDAGGVTRTPVTLGVIGGGWAQVLSGVHAGQRLVLADASAPLPTNTTGLGGGLGGRGGFGGRTVGTQRTVGAGG